MRRASVGMQDTSRKLPVASLSRRHEVCILSSLVRDCGQAHEDFLRPRDGPPQAVGALGSAPVKVNTPADRKRMEEGQPRPKQPTLAQKRGLLGPGGGSCSRVHLGQGCSPRERSTEGSAPSLLGFPSLLLSSRTSTFCPLSAQQGQASRAYMSS